MISLFHRFRTHCARVCALAVTAAAASPAWGDPTPPDAAAPTAAASGKARAAWLTASATVAPGQSVDTALQLTIDPGWHTYWINPGEGGMSPALTWRLPPGWNASPPSFPVPERFVTGGLHAFGYEGSVLLPVKLTAPAGFTGTATLSLSASWLTCHDDACVPGEASLTLTLTAGEPTPTPAAAAIARARTSAPTPATDLRLDVSSTASTLVLTVSPAPGASPTWAFTEAFAATPNVIDPAARITFTQAGNHWRAEAKRSEYLHGQPAQLELVLTGKSTAPRTLIWKK